MFTSRGEMMVAFFNPSTFEEKIKSQSFHKSEPNHSKINFIFFQQKMIFP